jgi:hypothetical protein
VSLLRRAENSVVLAFKFWRQRGARHLKVLMLKVKTDVHHILIYSSYCISQYQVFPNDVRLCIIFVLSVTVSAVSCTRGLRIDGIFNDKVTLMCRSNSIC